MLFTIDLTVDQYADWTYTWPALLAGSTGISVDFTGCTATMAWRVTPSDPAPFLAISTTRTTSGLIVLGPVAMGPTGTVGAGQIQANVSRAVLGASLSGITQLRYDLLLTWSNGQAQDIATGRVFINAGSDY